MPVSGYPPVRTRIFSCPFGSGGTRVLLVSLLSILTVAFQVFPGVTGQSVPGPRGTGGAITSSTQLAGAKISLEHRHNPQVTPKVPGLYRRGEHPIPGTLLFISPVPTLWGSALLPAGESQLSIEVLADLQTVLRAKPTDGSPVVHLAAETGTIDSPTARVQATLSSLTDENGVSHAVVTLRWGPFILKAPLTAVEQVVHEVRNFRLDTHRFPAAVTPGKELILGRLTEVSGERPSERVICVLRGGSSPLLRLEDVERSKLIASRGTLEKDLAAKKGRLRRLQLDPSGSEVAALEKELSRLETHLSAIQQRIESLGEGSGWRQLTAGEKKENTAPHWRARLLAQGKRVVIELSTPLGTYHYPID